MAEGGDRPNGFTFVRPGAFKTRDYSNEPLADLEGAYEHVDALVEQYKMLIPGSMARLMRGWHQDLWDAIEDRSDPAAQREDDETGDRCVEIGVERE